MELSTNNFEDLPSQIGPVVASITIAALTLTFATGSRPAQAATETADLVMVSLGLDLDPEIMRLLTPPPIPAGPDQPPSIRQLLLEVCAERGYGESCAQTLYGMMWKESQFVPTAVGDNGRALGYFQIHYRLHGIAASCATDVRCSANWTIDYLESNGYPKRADYAVQCHNGCGIANGYAASVKRWAVRKWAEADNVEERNRQATARVQAEAAERRIAADSGRPAADGRTDDTKTTRVAQLVAITGRERHQGN